ncbi:MAG: hypothetical protein QOG37_1167 [Mycobacterium sp.]|nr:hypothetical protein [Mycobacterium sp.]
MPRRGRALVAFRRPVGTGAGLWRQMWTESRLTESKLTDRDDRVFRSCSEYCSGPRDRKGFGPHSCDELIKPGARASAGLWVAGLLAAGCRGGRCRRRDRGGHLARAAGAGARTYLRCPTVRKAAVVHHPRMVLVVMAVMTAAVVSQGHAGEEDNRDDEGDPGDDRHPRCGFEDPRDLVCQCV